jgi:hypothetical protein
LKLRAIKLVDVGNKEQIGGLLQQGYLDEGFKPALRTPASSASQSRFDADYLAWVV